MMHIALAGINNQMSLLQDSGDEDQAQERVNRLAKILKDKEVSWRLKNAGYDVISCIIQRDEGRGPMRHSFHWSEKNHYYVEEPLMRHLEPPLSIYLELDKLKGYKNRKYTPSRDSQWHMYTIDAAKPLPFQRTFLRTLVRQPTKEWFSPPWGYQELNLSYTSRSILRSLVTAMEELELHVHNATVKSDHAHMYLYVLKEQHINDLVLFSQ
ncbi:acetyl-CoA carboxylase 1-like [Bidens hawaiensis]|uniref:acetyl-CoA carboxylase 1-like n=1 Tax=Bidens hawaiensis TaxID=980011 RepID=UPI004049FF9A